MTLLGVVAAGMVMRLAFASVYVGFDDRQYIEGAYLLAVGQQSENPHHFHARNGLVGSTATLFASFGVNEATAVAVPFACTALGFLAIFVIGRTLFDERTALIAVALLAVFPLDVIFATCNSPTVPIGLFGGTAILLFTLGERTRRIWMFAAAGAAFGIAATFAETPLLLLVPYAAYAATLGRPAREHVAALASMVAMLTIDVAVAAVFYGNPLARFNALARQNTVRGISDDVAEAGWNIEWLSQPLSRIASEQELGLYLLLGLPLAIWRLFKSNDRTERTLALFVAVLFVWISYGTVSPFTYAPLARLPRYFSLFQLPLVLLLALWLGRLPRTKSIAIGAAVLASSLACVVLDGSRNRADGFRRAHALIARDAPALLVVDEEARAPMLFFSGYEASMPMAVLRPDGQGYRIGNVLGRSHNDDDGTVTGRRTYVVAGNREARAWLARQPELTLLKRLLPSDTLYRRLLRSEQFRELLATVRSEYRMRGLEYAASDGEIVDVFEARPPGSLPN